MIITGQATVNSSTGLIELRAPLGFGAARGVRISNYTDDAVTLYNISGTGQDTQYLLPQTQMVYASDNVGRVPTANARTLSNTTVASNLLLEWSTDPKTDFIGTYPAALPSASPPAFFSTFLGTTSGSTTNTYPVSTYKSLRLYMQNTTTLGGAVQVTSHNSSGVASNNYTLGGVGGGSAKPGPTSGWITLPVQGNTVDIHTISNTVVYAYGVPDIANDIICIPDIMWGIVNSVTFGTAQSNNVIVNVMGPARMDYTAQIIDTTTDGFFGFWEAEDTSTNPPAPVTGFLDTATMKSTSARGLVASGSVYVPAGLQAVNFLQESATSGGAVRFACHLTPIGN